jgi:hypothetical protein
MTCRAKMLVPVALVCALVLCGILCSSAAPAADSATPIEKEVQAAVTDAQKSMEKLQASMRGEDQSAQQEAMTKYKALQKDLLNKLTALSKKDPKDPGTVDALIMIVYMGRNSPSSKEALTTLKRDYLNSPHIAPLCFFLESDEQDGPKLLKQIAENNPDSNAKAAALLCLARTVKESDEKQAEKYLQEVVTKYPNAKLNTFGREMNLASDAKNQLFAIQHLGIGKRAPEITGEDVDGKKFSLSDYRGKVVVVDFWGDW